MNKSVLETAPSSQAAAEMSAMLGSSLQPLQYNLQADAVVRESEGVQLSIMYSEGKR